MNYIILSSKPWNSDLADSLSKQHKGNWIRIVEKEEFNLERLQEIDPAMIFIPHWSYIIPEEIYDAYPCIVFHMTDLPYGRGGSPLQNLIARGHEKTMISAIRVEKGLDTGDVYLKRELGLLGTAEEIFIRTNRIVEKMILEIIEKDIIPIPQIGDPVVFKRRKPSMSSIEGNSDLHQLYDQIRMLDAEGYPKAFLETEHFKIEFSRASIKADGSIIADVRISKR